MCCDFLMTPFLTLSLGFSWGQMRSWLSSFRSHLCLPLLNTHVHITLTVNVSCRGCHPLRLLSPPATPFALSEVNNCLVFPLALLSTCFPLTQPSTLCQLSKSPFNIFGPVREEIYQVCLSQKRLRVSAGIGLCKTQSSPGK